MVGLAVAVLGATAWSLVGRGAPPPPAAARDSGIAVTATTVALQNVPILLASQGHLVPVNEVEIRPQLAGIVRGIHFHEGDDVAEGQLLFTLDAADAEAQLHRADAQAAQAEAQLAQAQREQARANRLRGSGALSVSALDLLASNVVALDAQRAAARAEVAAARVHVAQTRIVAPMAGRAGRIAVHPGSLAQPGDGVAMVRLVQLDPIAVAFTLPERVLPALQQARADAAVRVDVTQDGGAATVAGELVFVDNAVATSSGTIALKARIPNPSQAFWPGAFVRVRVAAGVDTGVALLPPQSVLESDGGHHVYRIDDGGTATPHVVRLLRVQDQHAVIDGLAGDERIIVEGLQDIVPGARVSVRDAPPASTDVALR